MSYGRFATPRFYMDNCNWQASKGLSRNSMITIDADEIGLNTGYTKYQLFNMNPIDYASFDTGTAGTGTVLVAIDLGVSGISNNSIAILNHNLATAAGNVTIKHHTSAITDTTTGTAVASIAAVLNGGSVGSGTSTPNNDGDTLLTFTASTDRYWAVLFEDVATWTATDLIVGEIVLAKYYTMPVSPDMPVTRKTAFDGVSVRRSIGGKAFGSSTWTAPNTGDYTPFRGATEETKMGGREYYDFSVGFVDDDDVYPEDRGAVYGSSNILGDIVNKSSMNLLPFIFAADSSSTDSGDYLWARFDQDSFETARKAWKAESFMMRVVQEF